LLKPGFAGAMPAWRFGSDFHSRVICDANIALGFIFIRSIARSYSSVNLHGDG
jgi:hypothetical protein